MENNYDDLVKGYALKCDQVVELEKELACLKSATLHTMTLCKCGKNYRLTRDKVCLKCRVAELEDQVKEHEWVSVADRLPEENGRFHVVKCNGMFRFGDSAIFMISVGKFKDTRVTHWKPINVPSIKE